jgi:environmental stress-induced protein Ves
VTEVIRREQFEKQRWANGLGYTHQIAIDCGRAAHGPTGDDDLVRSHHALVQSEARCAAKAPFLWRLSMADLAPPGGPFSEIQGVDRVLTLLRGDLELSWKHGFAKRTKLKLRHPLAFPADVGTFHRLPCACITTADGVLPLSTPCPLVN